MVNVTHTEALNYTFQLASKKKQPSNEDFLKQLSQNQTTINQEPNQQGITQHHPDLSQSRSAIDHQLQDTDSVYFGLLSQQFSEGMWNRQSNLSIAVHQDSNIPVYHSLNLSRVSPKKASVQSYRNESDRPALQAVVNSVKVSAEKPSGVLLTRVLEVHTPRFDQFLSQHKIDRWRLEVYQHNDDVSLMIRNFFLDNQQQKQMIIRLLEDTDRASIAVQTVQLNGEIVWKNGRFINRDGVNHGG